MQKKDQKHIVESIIHERGKERPSFKDTQTTGFVPDVFP